MRKALFVSALALLVTAYGGLLGAEPPGEELQLCREAIANAGLGELLDRDFSEKKILSGALYYMNDIQCVEPEYMANVAISVTLQADRPGEEPQRFYGIFHLHASPEGKLVSTAAFVPWTPLRVLEDMRKAWCEIIRSVYLKELKAQGCE